MSGPQRQGNISRVGTLPDAPSLPCSLDKVHACQEDAGQTLFTPLDAHHSEGVIKGELRGQRVEKRCCRHCRSHRRQQARATAPWRAATRFHGIVIASGCKKAICQGVLGWKSRIPVSAKQQATAVWLPREGCGKTVYHYALEIDIVADRTEADVFGL